MESTSHSSNMRFSVKMRMEKGIFTPSSMPYGYRLNGLEPEIVPEEAEVVRRIFSSALCGQGRESIARELNGLGIERGHDRKVWHHTTVYYILTNSFYTGDSVWHKFCTTDTLPFQKMKNRGQQPKYHVEDDHPAIISHEDFQRVQELIAQRREQFYDGSAPSHSPYTGKIYCGRCGSKFRRKVCDGKVYWDCYRHNAGKDQCPSHQISEETLTAATSRLHNKLTLHGQRLLQSLLTQLREIRELELRSNQRLSDIDKEIANISGQNLVLIRLKSKGCIDPALALSQTDELNRKLRDLRRLRRKVLAAADGDEQIQSTEAMLDYLDGAQWQTEVTPDLFENLVERITVASADEVKFRLLNGLELPAQIQPICGMVVCTQCGGRMARGTRSHGRVGWRCQNPDCGQVVTISDEALAKLVDGRLRELAQAPHLLTALEPQRAEVDMEAIRLQNELTLALNRGSEKPEYIKALALAAAAQRYRQLPDPTPAYELEQLRVRLEQDSPDADMLADLLAAAVRTVRLTPGKNVELELINGKIIAEKEAQSA